MSYSGPFRKKYGEEFTPAQIAEARRLIGNLQRRRELDKDVKSHVARSILSDGTRVEAKWVGDQPVVTFTPANKQSKLEVDYQPLLFTLHEDSPGATRVNVYDGTTLAPLRSLTFSIPGQRPKAIHVDKTGTTVFCAMTFCIVGIDWRAGTASATGTLELGTLTTAFDKKSSTMVLHTLGPVVVGVGTPSVVLTANFADWPEAYSYAVATDVVGADNFVAVKRGASAIVVSGFGFDDPSADIETDEFPQAVRNYVMDGGAPASFSAGYTCYTADVGHALRYRAPALSPDGRRAYVVSWSETAPGVGSIPTLLVLNVEDGAASLVRAESIGPTDGVCLCDWSGRSLYVMREGALTRYTVINQFGGDTFELFFSAAFPDGQWLAADSAQRLRLGATLDQAVDRRVFALSAATSEVYVFTPSLADDPRILSVPANALGIDTALVKRK